MSNLKMFYYRLQSCLQNFDLHRTVHRNVHGISIVNPTRWTEFTNLFYFWDNTLLASDGLSVHHQEIKTLNTETGIWQTGTAVCLIGGTRWKEVECYPKNEIKLWSWCKWLDLLEKCGFQNSSFVQFAYNNFFLIYYLIIVFYTRHISAP
jgi:hypothetical protein